MSKEDIAKMFDGCEACEMEWRGWGGRGCCETCDMHNYKHSCPEQTPTDRDRGAA